MMTVAMLTTFSAMSVFLPLRGALVTTIIVGIGLSAIIAL